jgi:maltooligosyltrehalose trehalohydrolase
MPNSCDIAPARIGAQVAAWGVNYRVWSPGQATVDVCVDQAGATRRLPLHSEGQGYWSGTDLGGKAGDLYRFKLGDGRLLPDVASRFQPDGVHGRSECIDPAAYRWSCDSWRRPEWRGQTIYEVHIGALTEEGTFASAASKLPHVRELGAEAVEIMPVADFAGSRNWGYDGAALYAPARCYGRPDDLRALVDAAHGLGLAVILDVVYNHAGPQGNYLHDYCAGYFRHDLNNPWGCAFNLDGDGSGPVREFLTANAAYWLDEFRFDGLRLDATHAIPDASPRHLLEEIADLAHARGGFVIAEDDRNSAGILRLRDGGGFGLDAAWADDFHHQIRVALTGTQKRYFFGYKGSAADIAETLENGWTYRGQPYPPWNGDARGSSCDYLPPRAFVYCIENHDQVGNRAYGERLEHLVKPEQFRAASMLLCLGPYVPLIFMGQEWAASSPFLFFCDHGGDLGGKISQGRLREISGSAAAGEVRSFPDPEAVSSFEKSKLCWPERNAGLHASTLKLYRECLRERKSLRAAGAFNRGRWIAQALDSFVILRYRLAEGDKMLVVTFQGGVFSPASLPEALSAPSAAAWRPILDSESPRFGGRRAGEAGEDASSWTFEGTGALWLEGTTKGNADAG